MPVIGRWRPHSIGGEWSVDTAAKIANNRLLSFVNKALNNMELCS
ncbi:hypothetical protein SAMN05192544_1008120 [Paraburkholderia hospita]|nr:hypothetical protein SAMN05192544_1008120 [Paraburkholderia hospita]